MSPVVIVIPGWLLAVAVAGCIALACCWRWWSPYRTWEVVKAELNFANMGKIEIRPNHDDIQIAHRAWVELATRKAGVPFDAKHDVIVELYDSWYHLFGRLRELAKDCPASKMRANDGTRELVYTLTSVLNYGVRPHLTRWQARFRRWYVDALESAPAARSPQEVQRDYLEYDELVADLEAVQLGLQAYMALLKKIATGQE